MKRIGLLSDTHGEIPDSVFSFFENCHEIWHAVISEIRILPAGWLRPLRAVYGISTDRKSGCSILKISDSYVKKWMYG